DPVPAARDGRALVREQERDTVLLEVLERRHHRWGALRDDDREHLVLLDELACVRDRVLRFVTVVVPDRPHLPAVDAPAVVDGLEAEIHPELRGWPAHRVRSRRTALAIPPGMNSIEAIRIAPKINGR